MLGHSFSEEIFSNSQSEPFLVQLEYISPCSFTGCLGEEMDSRLITPPFTQW